MKVWAIRHTREPLLFLNGASVQSAPSFKFTLRDADSALASGAQVRADWEIVEATVAFAPVAKAPPTSPPSA